MQLQFLAPVELFFKQLKGLPVFDPGGTNIFLFMQFFSAVRFVMSTLLSRMERSNHCGRSKDSNK